MTVPIGRPIANARCHVLDIHMRPVPAGVTGELFIGGVGLARGYLNRPELTAEKFVADPFEPGQRLYRTGDSARYLADGRLEYLGRSDAQVKIRGMRIELGEIEAALNALPGVQHSVVVAREDRPGSKQLVAYLVAPGSMPGELRSRLAEWLPEALLPSAFVLLPQLPTLANGKIDRQSLPAPDFGSERAAIVAPRDRIERAVWQVWQELLASDAFGVHENFFELGGHSLSAMQVVSRLRDRLGIELPLRTLFDLPSVAGLSGWISAQQGGPLAAPLAPAPADAAVPLTAAQRGLWFVERLQGHSAANHLIHASRLRGALDVPALQRSLQLLCERHDSLRSLVVERDGVPLLERNDAARWELQHLDLMPSAASTGDQALQQQLTQFARAPFELAQGPLARAGLIPLDPNEHVLILVVHHLVSDGWSMDILLRELGLLYQAEVEKRPVELADLPLQWRDLAFHEHSLGQSAQSGDALDYWRKQLHGLEPLRLPPEVAASTGAAPASPLETMVLPKALVHDLEGLARQHKATVFMVMLAAFKLLLMRRYGRDDVAVGTPVAGRDRPELEPMVGLLLNTLVLRTDLSGNPSFEQLLQRVRVSTLEAFAHQHLPFDRLVAELAPARSADLQPFFDVMVNAFGRWSGALALPGLQAQPMQFGAPPPRHALSLYIQAQPGEIGLGLMYRTDRLSADAARCLLDQFGQLLQQLVMQPGITLAEFSLLTPSTRELLDDPSVTLAAPAFTSVLQSFLRCADRFPGRAAILHAQRHHDYASLKLRSGALARRLRQLGVQPGDVVAISGPRSLAVVAAMLASQMCGAVFMTLDPALPSARRQAMLGLAKARWLCLIGRDAASDAGEASAQGLTTLDLDPMLDALVADDLLAQTLPTSELAECGPDDPAYIFFTSGSTGTPKAVLGRHRGLSHFIDWQRREFAVTPADRVAHLVGLSFDPMLRDVFLPLTSGACLCIPQERDLLDPLAWLASEAVSMAHTTPTLLQSWLQGSRAATGPTALRWLFLAGEPLTDTLIRQWRDRHAGTTTLVNLYGPTETTMARCFHVLGDSIDPGMQTVGRPLPDSQALVLTAQGRRCGIGEAGEVVLRTPMRSLGYVGLEEENQRRFRKNPWRDDVDDLLYFTGDRGRIRTDGRLEILGRLDDQVKIRGVRIEPAEVMAALAGHSSVRQCAVLPMSGAEGQTLLAAYVAPHPGATLDAATLRAHIARSLPEAFIPGAFVFMDKLPMQANGKVDRQALPRASADIIAATDKLVMPRSAVEQVLWDIWRSVLQVESFGVYDNFFELGGHSLLATQVLARLRDVLEVELPLRTLFDLPSIAALAARVEQALHDPLNNADVNWPALERIPRDGLLPTSFSQRRMWLVQQFNPQTAAYNMPFALRLRGALNRQVLGQTLEHLVARHESFRTTLVTVAGEPMQRIWSAQEVPIEFIDLRSLPAADRVPEAARALHARGIVPYDLARGPLHRISLLQLDSDDHVLFWSIHHAIGDGWSSGVLMREVARTYPALLQGQEPSLPAMTFDFADYAAWQRRAFDSHALEHQLDYWKDKLAGLLPLPLPFDRPRRTVHDGRGSRVSASFKPQTLAALKALAVKQGVTPYMALLATFQLLLARHCGVTDVAVGTPVANRTQLSSEHLVGTLVNTVVMRTDLSGDPGFTDLLARVRETALQAFAHQDLPFEALVEAMPGQRADGAAPLVQVLFNVLNPPQVSTRMADIDYEPFDYDSGTSQFDLALSIDTELFGHATLSFSLEVFDAATGKRLLYRYMALLDQILADPERALSRFDMTSTPEQDLLLKWNNTDAPPGDSRLLHFEVEQQRHLTPRAIALRSGAQQLSYAGLERRATQLAHALRQRGVCRGALVGLCVSRDIGMLVAQLAILKAGAAYVPLDPDYPVDRLAYMAQDARLALLISESALLPLLEQLDWPREQTLLLDADAESVQSQPETALASDATLDARPQDPAYVIYTSGSTGRPKGVCVPHGAVVNFLASMAREPGLDAGDVLVAVTTLSFDIAVLELLLPLCVGAQVVLASREQALDGRALRAVLESSGATVMQATPSTWRMLIEAGWQGSARFKALIGGEGLPPDLAQQLLARSGSLWNLYGPTETTVWSSCWKVVAPEQGIRIGRPIANTQVHILDEHGQRCPIGVAGEIFIGGEGVTLGYHNQPELTAQRFVPDRFSEVPAARLYRTGDRGRWTHDGLLEHLGRLDHQVKVRGHRIELGEIEAVLAEHAQLAQALVVVREDRPGDVRLVAYGVAPQDAQVPAAAALREHVRARLPAYMVPQHFVGLPALPLLPNGKIDRKALPAPAELVEEGAAQDLPQTPAEQAVALIWQELLDVPQVARTDNFFDLGGHSLLAMRALHLLHERAGIVLELRRLVFENLAQIAATPAQSAPATTSTPEAKPASTGLGRVLRSVKDLIGG